MHQQYGRSVARPLIDAGDAQSSDLEVVGQVRKIRDRGETRLWRA